MALLSDIIGQAKSQIKQNAKISAQAAIDSVKQAGANVVLSKKNDVVNVVNQSVNAAINAGVSGAVGAASAAITGDFQGAAERLFDIPGAAMGAIGDVLGVASGAALENPGVSYSMSSDGGIGEGNALYGALSRADPLMSIGWYAQLPVLQPPGMAPATLPWYYVETANTPFRTFDDHSIFRAGHHQHFASKYSVDNLSLGFYADSAGNSLSYLRAWQASIISPTGLGNYNAGSGNWYPPKYYKRPIFIYLLDPARMQIAIIQYVNCWPINIDSLSLESDNSSRLILNVNFSVDDVFVITTDLSPLSIESIIKAANPIPELINAATNGVMKATSDIVNKGVSGIGSAVGSAIRSIF